MHVLALSAQADFLAARTHMETYDVKASTELFGELSCVRFESIQADDAVKPDAGFSSQVLLRLSCPVGHVSVWVCEPATARRTPGPPVT